MQTGQMTSLHGKEPPISIEPTRSYVSLTDGKTGIAVIPTGSAREYEVLDDSKIRLSIIWEPMDLWEKKIIYHVQAVPVVEKVIVKHQQHTVIKKRWNLILDSQAMPGRYPAMVSIDTLAKQL
ncbi:MAG: hypothetical protein ACLS54_08810 [Anaerostipes hadrus]